ncbi:MAG: hypothetical protein M3R24_23755 [Chloroflexota bacterium]|nr:hypothetical protein [Chloroflexota bacterium]
MKEMKIALIDVPLMIAVCMLTMFFVQNDIRQKTARIDTTYRQSMRPTHNQLVDLSLKLRRHVLHRDATRAESVSQFTDMENQYTDLFAKVSTLTPPDAKVSQYGMLQAAPNGCTHGINGMAEEIEGGRTISSGFEDARDEFRRCSDAITALL